MPREVTAREHDTILDEIEGLLEANGPDTGAALARMEETLTSGYAHALALEAQRWRLEQRLGAIAAELGEGAGNRSADDLARLARSMSSAEGHLGRLRELLRLLRDRARALRAEMPPPA